ncbi:hypothetical protein ACWEQL_20270 [Kitasatospora sp. NPDC004240]
MGTNSKSSHSSYAVAPTVAVESPAAPVGLGDPPVASATALTESDLALLQAVASELDPAASPELSPEPGIGAAADSETAFGSEGASGSTGDPAEQAVLEPAAAEADTDQTASTKVEPQTVEVVDAAEGVDVAQGAEPEPEEEEEEGDPPLTPVPHAPPVGLATGVPILVGGEDFLHSQATLVAYQSTDGPREVLLAHVSEEAEGKLLEALTVAGTKMVDVEVEEKVNERLPLDKNLQLAELVTAATTSVQHKLKSSSPMSEASIQKHQKALDAVQNVLNTPGLSDDEKVMAQYYLDQVNLIGEKINNGGAPMPHFAPHGHEVTKMVTKQIPAPSEDPEPGTLAAQLRDASRINATLNPQTGETSWDGQKRSSANGKEYAIELGDGWSAVYRPYAANDPNSTDFSMRGQLEVHAPVGAGHGGELVERLEQLHLVNKPMTAAEGEWTYLTNNITAQGLGDSAGMKEAISTAKGMEDLQVQELVHQRAESLIGLSEDELHYQVKRIQLEAAQTALPKKVAVLREAVAKATGFEGGDALAASAGYHPVPTASGGWLTWSRFDVTGQADKIKEAFSGKSLTHSIGSGSMLDVFSTGVLASTEKRAVMGIGGGIGMSEGQDKKTGGANSVFLRVSSTSSAGFGGHLVWDNPSVLMGRSDYYAYNSDQYGVSPDKKKVSGLTRDPMKIATHTASGNEIMFRDGIDLLGAEAPSRIMCNGQGERASLLENFKARGITHLGGKAVEDVVQSAY